MFEGKTSFLEYKYYIETDIRFFNFNFFLFQACVYFECLYLIFPERRFKKHLTTKKNIKNYKTETLTQVKQLKVISN